MTGSMFSFFYFSSTTDEMCRGYVNDLKYW